jgi:anoctamin-10
MSIYLAKYTDLGTHTLPIPPAYRLLMTTRVRDWIHGVRTAAPSKVTRESLEAEPLYEAERLRIIYQLITNPASEGGAGITPKEGEWQNVESIFALHDHAYNKDWIKKWSSQYILKTEDLDDIRNRLGEKVIFMTPFPTTMS